MEKWAVTLGVPIYEKLLSWISDVEPTGSGQGGNPTGTRLVPKPGVDPAVWRWIEGATKVNAGEGFFADFIREYTKIQYRIRGGDASLAEAKNQQASNEIALNLANDILANGNLPGISGLGAIDAGAAASTVFTGGPHGSSGDYAPWAGTLLFPYLGFDQFFSDLLLSSETVEAAIPTISGGSETKIIKHIEGTYDLLAALVAMRDASNIAGFSNIFEAVSNLFSLPVIDQPFQGEFLAIFNSFAVDT